MNKISDNVRNKMKKSIASTRSIFKHRSTFIPMPGSRTRSRTRSMTRSMTRSKSASKSRQLKKQGKSRSRSSISGSKSTRKKRAESHIKDGSDDTKLDEKTYVILLVMPGCSHCENFEPDWESIKNLFENSSVICKKLTAGSNFMKEKTKLENEIQTSIHDQGSYPTILKVKNKITHVFPDDSVRDKETVVAWIKSK